MPLFECRLSTRAPAFQPSSDKVIMAIHSRRGGIGYRLGWVVLGITLVVWFVGASIAQDPAKPSLTAEQRARLQERDHLAAEAVKLWNAGKKEEGVAAWRQKLAIEQEVLGAHHQDVVKSQRQLDQLLEVLADEHDQR